MTEPRDLNAVAALRAGVGFKDNALRAPWERVGEDGTSTALAFDHSGNFLAVGGTAGNVEVYDVFPVRQVVRTLTLPPSLEGTSPTICLVAWACNSRFLFTGTLGGVIAVWDVLKLRLLRAFKPPSATRAIRPHPICPSLLLLVPLEGLPWVVQWTRALDMHDNVASSPVISTGAASSRSAAKDETEGWAWQIDESVLPPPRGGGHGRWSNRAAGTATNSNSSSSGIAANSGAGGGSGTSKNALRCDAAWHSRHGRSLYLVTSRSDLAVLRVSAVEEELDRIAGLRPNSNSLHSNNDSGLPGTICGSNGGITVYRMACSHLSAAAVSPPELLHSRTSSFLAVSLARGGIVLHDEDSLAPVERGYAERVDNTPLLGVRLSPGDAWVMAVPQTTSGHMRGSLFAFRRGAVGDHTRKRGPPEGLALFDVHPRQFIVAGISHTGRLYLLQQQLAMPRTGYPGESASAPIVAKRSHKNRCDPCFLQACTLRTRAPSSYHHLNPTRFTYPSSPPPSRRPHVPSRLHAHQLQR